jgi:hypothetical protein
MQKRTIVKKIKSIIEKYGNFYLNEIEGAEGISVNKMGGLLGLAEFFDTHTVGIYVYDTHSFDSDEIHIYEENYEDLPKDVLEEILFIAEMLEADQIKTLKRISD